jgi:hypothetical protein
MNLTPMPIDLAAFPAPGDPKRFAHVMGIGEKLLSRYGLAGWKIAGNSRLAIVAGRCRNDQKVVEMNTSFHVARSRPEDIIDTLRHEVAHALAGWEAGHRVKWKNIAVQIGASPERCYPLTMEGMPRRKSRGPQPIKYKATCPVCGWTHSAKRMRECDLNRYTCNGGFGADGCGGNLIFVPVDAALKIIEPNPARIAIPQRLMTFSEALRQPTLEWEAA